MQVWSVSSLIMNSHVSYILLFIWFPSLALTLKKKVRTDGRRVLWACLDSSISYRFIKFRFKKVWQTPPTPLAPLIDLLHQIGESALTFTKLMDLLKGCSTRYIFNGVTENYPPLGKKKRFDSLCFSRSPSPAPLLSRIPTPRRAGAPATARPRPACELPRRHAMAGSELPSRAGALPASSPGCPPWLAASSGGRAPQAAPEPRPRAPQAARHGRPRALRWSRPPPNAGREPSGGAAPLTMAGRASSGGRPPASSRLRPPAPSPPEVAAPSRNPDARGQPWPPPRPPVAGRPHAAH